jgi:Carboxypeptidase regulatory-like domain/TonB-dependent Receptor Plug Domain
MLVRFFYGFVLSVGAVVCLPVAQATELMAVRGVVHDPGHRPIADATVTLHAADSDLVENEKTNANGEFSFSAVPPGVYIITAAQSGFNTEKQTLTVASNTSPVLHFELEIAAVQQSVTVTTATTETNVDSSTPTTLISRQDIARTPGASRTNSMAMITDYVPGAYMTHDMLHMRGGHELSWMIDGVNIPNTNIASNIAPQIDPKDIDYLEANRGSYNASLGDRTYGIFDVVPRTGACAGEFLPDQRPAQPGGPFAKVRLVHQPQRQSQQLWTATADRDPGSQCEQRLWRVCFVDLQP